MRAQLYNEPPLTVSPSLAAAAGGMKPVYYNKSTTERRTAGRTGGILQTGGIGCIEPMQTAASMPYVSVDKIVVHECGKKDGNQSFSISLVFQKTYIV